MVFNGIFESRAEGPQGPRQLGGSGGMPPPPYIILEYNGDFVRSSMIFLCVSPFMWLSKLCLPLPPILTAVAHNLHRARCGSPRGSRASHSLYEGISSHASLNLHCPFDISPHLLNSKLKTNKLQRQAWLNACGKAFQAGLHPKHESRRNGNEAPVIFAPLPVFVPLIYYHPGYSAYPLQQQARYQQKINMSSFYDDFRYLLCQISRVFSRK